MPKLRFVFDRRKEADNYKTKGASRTADVLVEVYYRQRRKWFKTGVKVFDGQWDVQKMVINRPDAAQLNSRLSTIMSRANAVVTAAVDRGSFSISSVEAVFRCDEGEDSMKAEVEKQIEIHRQKGLAETGINNIKSMYSSLVKFGRIRYIEDLTSDNVVAFREYLIEQKKGSWTVYHYMGRLNLICQRLVNEGRIPENPFGNIQQRRPYDDEIRYLTEDELLKIENMTVEKGIEEYARDLFIFQANTGMAFKDASSVSIDDVVCENGKMVYRSKRAKTKVRFAIIILPKALEVLRKYGQFNMYTLSYVNMTLHILGRMVLGKKITSHMARHTFAVRALSHGIPIEYVSKMLGHTNIITTQRYAKVLAEDVLKQFDKLM